jgi:hypothetical protein
MRTAKGCATGGCDAGRVCGSMWAERLTRINPLVICGLVCGLVEAGGASWPSGLAAWPAPLASLDDRDIVAGLDSREIRGRPPARPPLRLGYL